MKPSSEALDQASAILKAAEKATPGPVQVFWDVENESVKLNAQPSPALRGFTKTIATGLSEEDAAFFVMARKSTPSIASALLEKHKALEEALGLFRSICSAYEDQDLNHVDFRVKCAEFAQDFLARQGETAPAASVSNQIAGMKEKSE